MALTSIHVQYNRYTVTESNTSIKEQKIWTPTRSKQPSSLQLQLTCCLQHMTHVYALKCLLDILIFIICARMVWTYMRTKEKIQNEEIFSFRWVFQAMLWAWRSMQVNSSTSHTSSKVIGCLKTKKKVAEWQTTKSSNNNKAKCTIGPISQRQRKNVGCL